MSDSDKMDPPKSNDAPRQVDSPKPADPVHAQPKLRARLSKSGKVLIVLAVLFVAVIGVLYHYIVSGGMIARQKPAAVETFIANWLVDLSIPNDVKGLKNPLSSSPGGADAAAGRELYQKNCQACHGYDGSGKTEAGLADDGDDHAAVFLVVLTAQPENR